MANQTKDTVIAKLTELGIAFDPNDTKANLVALLPQEDQETEDDASADAPDLTTREGRWAAFLAKAEKENPLFAKQKEKGEFDAIPASFI